MARRRNPFVMSGGRLQPRCLYEADPLDIPAGACSVCGGTGFTIEQIDDDRLPEPWPCWKCKRKENEMPETKEYTPTVHRAHTTEASDRGRPLMVRFAPRYLEIWRKGKREKFYISYEMVYDLARRKSYEDGR